MNSTNNSIKECSLYQGRKGQGQHKFLKPASDAAQEPKFRIKKKREVALPNQFWDSLSFHYYITIIIMAY